MAAGKGVQKQVMALARIEPLQQQADRRRWASSIGPAASNSGSSAAAGSPPCDTPASTARVASASSDDKGILPPAQAGTMPRWPPTALRTKAAMSWVRTYASTRPPKTKQSPGLSRAMKLSSTWPSVPPPLPALDHHFTNIDDSPTMVPTCSRWRWAMLRSGTRQAPSTSATRW